MEHHAGLYRTVPDLGRCASAYSGWPRRWYVTAGALVLGALIGMGVGFTGGGWSQEYANGVAAAVRRAEPTSSLAYAVCVTLALRNDRISSSEALAAIAGDDRFATIVGQARDGCRGLAR